ncbi:MAG: sugar transferase [Eubacteriales bacterium]|nr:sugar transferase [Eubacteriales bacterium]
MEAQSNPPRENAANPLHEASALPRWDGALSHPFYSKVVKRALDLLMAIVLLPLFAVVALPIALAVKLSSEGPVFYTALRGGYHNKPFNILKFRTMVVGADKYSGTTALNDPRVTRVGRFLRRTKLDELPQLLNVLKGDMSFIGPRPELLKYTLRYTPEQQCILWVRPGVSDPSSIHLISLDEAVGHDDPEGSYERNILTRKNEMRVAYARSQSFGLDAGVFFTTLGCVARKFVPQGTKKEKKP